MRLHGGTAHGGCELSLEGMEDNNILRKTRSLSRQKNNIVMSI